MPMYPEGNLCHEFSIFFKCCKKSAVSLLFDLMDFKHLFTVSISQFYKVLS